MYTDSHCHIEKKDYDNPKKIIEDAYSANVKRIICSGVDYETNIDVLKLANENGSVFATLGHFPATSELVEENIKYIKDNICNKKVVAIGEIGLDYHYENYNATEQIKVFKILLDIAKRNSIPVVIHSRDAFQDTYNLLKESGTKGVIHSFTGNINEAKAYIDLGFYLGINGVVTFKNSNLIEVLKAIPISKIILETDSPYLTPVPYRGEKNEPKRIVEIIEFLSKNLEIDKQKLAIIFEENLCKIFDKAHII